MKLKKLTYTVLGMIFIFVILITINLQASNSLKAVVQSSKNELKKAEEVVITLKLDEYQDIKNGINAYKATLDYDESIFEQVLEENFLCKNSWELLKYNKDTKELVAIKKAGSTVPEEVVQVTLKVKEEIQPKTTNIKMKDIVTSDGKEDVRIDEANVIINIIVEQEEIPEEPNKPEKITSNKYKIEGAYISKIAPKTTVAGFKKNITLENVTTNPKMMFTDESGNVLQDDSLIKTGTKLKVGSTLQFTLVVIGDIDGDSEVTVRDLAKMKLHIIKEELLTGTELKAADIDEDKDITVRDLARMKLILINLLEIE